MCALLALGAMTLHDAPRVDVVAVNLAPLIDRAAQSPSRFAVDVPHVASPSTVGQWSQAADVSTWTHSLQVPGAVSMSFHATEVFLPASAVLTVSAHGMHYVYTARDTDRGELWSRIGRGDSLTFEISVATEDVDEVRLEIASLQVGYRAFAAGMSNHSYYDERQSNALAAESAGASCAESWTCNVTPANEGAGNATVALIVSNVGQCTGVLLNNVPGDGTPYVLTARHCQNGDPDGGLPSAAANVTAYWNAITACGAPLGSIYDPGILTQRGAQTVVEQQDAWLIRLDRLPIVDAYYAGWDATGGTFVGGFTPHHAAGTSRQFIGWHGQAAYLTVSTTSKGDAGVSWRSWTTNWHVAARGECRGSTRTPPGLWSCRRSRRWSVPPRRWEPSATGGPRSGARGKKAGWAQHRCSRSTGSTREARPRDC